MAKKSKYYSGIFTPKNMNKYIGDKLPVFRSSWEKTVFILCDTNPAVFQWGSECVKIGYFDPVANKLRTYYPDMLIKYKDAKNVIHIELVEIKPLSQTVLEKAKSKRDKLELATNHAKWKAAQEWCSMNNVTFRVITEKQIYGKATKKK